MSSTLRSFLIVFCLLASTHAHAEADAAREAMVAGSYRQAASLLGAEAARADDQTEPHLRYLQGRAQQLAGDHRGAIRTFDRLADDFPESPWAHKARFCRADSQAETGRVVEAATTYREEADRLLGQERRDEIAQLFLTYAHAAFDPDGDGDETTWETDAPPDHATARVLFTTALELEPSDAMRHDAEHHLARCLLQLGDAREARRILADRLDDPDDPQAALDRFHLARAAGRLQSTDGVRQYHLLLTLHPDHDLAATALWEAALLQAPDGPGRAVDLEGAVADLRALLDRWPDAEAAPDAHLRLPRVLAWNGRLERAADAYREFIDAPHRAGHDERAAAMVELARLLERLDRADDAVAVYRRYSADYPTHEAWAEVQVHLSDADLREGLRLVHAGDLDLAVEALTRHADAHPAEDGQARYLVGLLRYRQARIDEAERALSSVASKYPHQAWGSRAEYALARIGLEERSDVDAAREHLESCLQHGGVRYAECSSLLAELGTEGLDLYVDRPLHTGESARVWLRARNLEQVELTLHRVDPEILMRKEGSVEAMDSLDVELIEPDRRWRLDLDGATDGLTFTGPVDLPIRQAGVYVVGVTGKTRRAQIQVVVSDITIATHRQGNDVLVYVQDRRRGTPVRGAQVLLSDGYAVFTEGTTGADGVMVHRPGPGGEITPPTVVALAMKGRQMATSAVSGSGSPPPETLPLVHYLYTDRSAYRPGDTVGYRVLMRRVHDRRADTLVGRPVRVRLQSPRGWSLQAAEATLDRYGAAGGTLDLDPEFGPGQYRLEVDLLDGDGLVEATLRAGVQVTDTPPSRRQLDIAFDREVYVLGDEVVATVRASTWTGEPVPGIRLSAHWSHEHEPVQTNPTDADGVVQLRASTLNHGGLARLQLTVSFPGDPLQVREAAMIRDAEFTLALAPDRSRLTVGEVLHADVLAQAVSGDGVQTDVDLALYHVPVPAAVEPWSGNPFAVPLWEEEASLLGSESVFADPTRELSIRTDPEGQGRTEWELRTPGTWRLAAIGRDDRGHAVHAETRVEVLTGPGDSRGLALLADRTTLGVDERARVRVLGAGDGPVLAVVDADGIASVRVVTLGEGGSLEVPMMPGLAPHARLSVFALRGDDLLSGQVDFEVRARLQVDLQVPAEASPGEQVRAVLEVLDEAGQPVDAQLSVAVVDASLLAQFPELRGAVEGIFLARDHALEATTAGPTALRSVGPGVEIDADILAEMERLAADHGPVTPIRPEDIGLYDEADAGYWLDAQFGAGGLGARGTGLGGGGYGEGLGSLGTRGRGAGASGYGGGVAQIRRFRAESALWLPDLRTDADGAVEVTIPLPDHAAAWRVIVVACDTGQRTGEAAADLVARAPLAVTLAAPTFARPGDAPSLVADVLADDGGPYALQGRLGTHELLAEARDLVPGTPDVVRLAGAPLTAADAVRAEDGTLLVPVELSARGALGEVRDHRGVLMVLDDPPLERWLSGRAARSTELTLPWPEGVQGDATLVVEVAPGDLPGALALALARPSCSALSPYTSAHVAFATTSLLDGPRRMPEASAELLRSLARSRVLDLMEDHAGARVRWSSPGRGNDGTLTAHGYVALVQGLRADLVPVGARPQAETAAAAARAELLSMLRDGSSRGAPWQARLLNALSVESGDEAAWSAALTRLARTVDANDPVALGRLVSAGVRFGAREEVAGLAGELREALTAAIAGDDPAALAATTEGMAALHPGDPLLTEAEVAIGRQLDRPWLPIHQVAELSAALAQVQGAAGLPAAVEVTLPDGTRHALDFSRDATAVRLTAPLPRGEARLLLEPTGRGTVHYRAGVLGRPTEDGPLPDDPRLDLERRSRRQDLVFRGIPLDQGFASLTGTFETWFDELIQLPVGRETEVEVTVHYGRDQHTDPRGTIWVLEERLPGGATVVPGSLRGPLHAEVRDDRIVAWLDGSSMAAAVRYRLRAASPGTWTVPAPTLRRLDDGQVFEVGGDSTLSVVPAGSVPPSTIAGLEVPPEVFHATPDELAELGRRLAEEERWGEAAEVLDQLLVLGTPARGRGEQVAATLLTASVALEDQQGTLAAFEMLKERNPGHQIPFDEVVAVARAYEGLGEHRRALRAYRTTLDARFLTEARLGRTLERENLVLPSLRFVYDLTTAYPDLPAVQASLFHLPQIWADRAATASTDPAMRSRGYSRDTLLATSADWMLEFAARHPDSPLAEEAGFHLASTYLEFGDDERTIATCRAHGRRHAGGSYHDDFLYMEGLARLAQRNDAAALALLRRVAEGRFAPPGGGTAAPSEQRPLALYSIARIHDAAGRFDAARDAYREVTGRFRDAAEAVARMEQVVLTTEPVTTVPLSEAPRLEVHSRNVPTADLLLYRVDLMRLYLREKDLSGVTDIRLAGIEPAHQRKVRLDRGGWRDAITTLPLPLDAPGAWLVVLKGDRADVSAMVLRTDLDLQVQEDRNAGRVRITITDPDGRPVHGAHVKVLGTSGGAIVSGDTDLRGVFTADGVHGVPTVIARQDEHYAFWRGPQQAPPPLLPAAAAPVDVDLMEQLRALGYVQRQSNRAAFDEAYYESAVEGVSIDTLE